MKVRSLSVPLGPEVALLSFSSGFFSASVALIWADFFHA